MEGLKLNYDRNALKYRKALLGINPEQNILDVIQQSCSDILTSDDFGKTLQSIKASFVEREYGEIFKNPHNLHVYSAAYVPGRALCYFEIFCMPQLRKLLARSTRIYAVGSGSGSELVSLAAAMTRVPEEYQKVNLVLQDFGEWATVLQKFENTVRNLWKLDQDRFTVSFQKGDVLNPENKKLQTQHLESADLITLMFVINELFQKKAEAMTFIQNLYISMKKGSYLLVVESAGSFSHLKVGNSTYMVYTLLDALKDLKCIISENSQWYRYPEQLKYPLEIQNMRYFIRLYKKL